MAFQVVPPDSPGAVLGNALGVLLGRWALRHPGRPRGRRVLSPPLPAEHAGQYVDPARVRAGVWGQNYPSFRRR